MEDQSVTDRQIQSVTDSGRSADRPWENWSLYMHTYTFNLRYMHVYYDAMYVYIYIYGNCCQLAEWKYIKHLSTKIQNDIVKNENHLKGH